MEEWPYIMGKLGAEKKKHWWTELWERGSTDGEGEAKAAMEET